MDDLYNLIVEIISYLLQNTDADFYKRYDSRTEAVRKHENDTIHKSIPLLFEGDSEHYRELGNGREGISKELLEQVQSFFVLSKDRADDKCLLRVLEFLDMALERQMTKELESRGNTATKECLNSNANILKMGIVPRCICYWERGHRGSQHYARIDNYLKNILLIDYRALGELDIVHHYLPVNTFAAAEKRERLVVAISPLDRKKNFQVEAYEREDSRYFSLQHDGNVEEENKYIKGIIREAADSRADILIFPEACGNTMMAEEISEYLQEPFWIDQDKPPAITVLPGVWSENKNTSHVMSGTGDVICSQNKQEAYLEPTENGNHIYEDIVRDDTVHLIHGIGIGRMVVMICKDFISSDYLDSLLKELKVTLILVPSFSSGYHDFEMISGKLLSADCCAVWVNALAAVTEQKTEEKRLGLIVRSGKNKVKEKVEFYIEKSDPKEKCVGSSLKVWDMYYKTTLGR